MHQVRFHTIDGRCLIGVLNDGTIEADGEIFESEEVTYLPPVEPSKIVCAAANYRAGYDSDAEHPAEPILFLKTPNALSGHREMVELPAAEQVYYEGELAAVIGEECRNVDEDEVAGVLAGYTCANDISDRTVENMVRRKAFDGAAPLGPALVPPNAMPPAASIETRINGEVTQESTIEDMVFSVPELVADISRFQTLYPGDVILTGSPPGMDTFVPGDNFEVEIEGIGTLTHDVTV
jgi:2-keto-4-pentenoate hydratase/2-oxohepta-3-ene-1,7-dioic acid hydratase in catechol pathway